MNRFVPDAWLLDHVFQPASERLSRFGTCFDLARGCGYATMLFLAVGAVALYKVPISQSAGPLVLVAVLVGGCLWGLGKVERRVKPGLANPLRCVLLTARLMYLFYAIRDCLGFSHHINPVGGTLWSLLDVLGLLAFYFASCSPMPPVARSMSVPDNAALEAS